MNIERKVLCLCVVCPLLLGRLGNKLPQKIDNEKTRKITGHFNLTDSFNLNHP